VQQTALQENDVGMGIFWQIIQTIKRNFDSANLSGWNRWPATVLFVDKFYYLHIIYTFIARGSMRVWRMI